MDKASVTVLLGGRQTGKTTLAQMAAEIFQKRTSAWEGFALEQVLALFGSENAYFWRTQRGAELDLLLFRSGKRWGFEFKRPLYTWKRGQPLT